MEKAISLISQNDGNYLYLIKPFYNMVTDDAQALEVI